MLVTFFCMMMACVWEKFEKALQRIKRKKSELRVKCKISLLYFYPYCLQFYLYSSKAYVDIAVSISSALLTNVLLILFSKSNNSLYSSCNFLIFLSNNLEFALFTRTFLFLECSICKFTFHSSFIF